jgi:hypothetical protein
MRTFAVGVLWAIAVGAFGCSSSRAPTDDGGVETSLDPTGSWDDCDTHWVFADDGSTTREELARACTAVGRWTVEGDQLHIDWDERCEGDADALDATLGFGVDSLLILARDAARPMSFAVAGTPIEAFTLIDDLEPTQRTVIRLVGNPEVGIGSGCYWAEDRACGGLLSCSGRILQWRTLEDGAGDLRASTTCTGDCPCGAILDLTPTGEGYDVAYSGLNCGGTFGGTARALPRPE